MWGYTSADFSALWASTRLARGNPRGGEAEGNKLLRGRGKAKGKTGALGYGTIGRLGLREPNTFAYALCDSPVGLLSLICSVLRRANPTHTFAQQEIIDVTQLAWLPGPEAGLRFWASAVKELAASPTPAKDAKTEAKRKTRIALTVFDADGSADGYTPPAWCPPDNEVVFAQRVDGAAGLVVWERADVLLDGIRGLARELVALDARLRVRPLEQVVVAERDQDALDEECSLQLDVESPDTVVAYDVS